MSGFLGLPSNLLPLLPGVEPPGGRGARLRGQDSGDPPADSHCLILCCMRAFEAHIAGALCRLGLGGVIV